MYVGKPIILMEGQEVWFLTRFTMCHQYISLLYCIMHSLTFAWNAKYLLKPLEGTLKLSLYHIA